MKLAFHGDAMRKKGLLHLLPPELDCRGEHRARQGGHEGRTLVDLDT